MALSQSALSELLEAFRTGEGVNLVRDAVQVALQELIELEASGAIGAAKYERTESRTVERNGSRDRLLATQAGDVELRIPKLRKGSFFPSILEPRRRIDRALYAVVMEAYVGGISTRGVDDLVAAMGSDAGISKSEVSRICAGLDEQVTAFRTRSLDHIAFPYIYLDATYLHVRSAPAGQVVSMAVVVATGITATGGREILGVDVGDSEDETFWRTFLAGLKQRGLSGVGLVISDQHAGLVAALAPQLPRRGASTLPGPLRPEPARPRSQEPQRHGRRGVPHHLRPTRRGHRRRDLRPGPRPTRRPVPQDRPADGPGQSRSPRLRHVPPVALGQDLVEQPAGTHQQGDQTSFPGRRDLPQRHRRHPTRRRGPGRRRRRMAGLRTPLPLRNIHGATASRDRY